jgi:hypothetical protein
MCIILQNKERMTSKDQQDFPLSLKEGEILPHFYRADDF